METKVRSIVKAATWRMGGLIMTVSVAWIVTGKPSLAASIGAIDTLVKLGAFYVHERLWLKIRFGRLRPPDFEI